MRDDDEDYAETHDEREECPHDDTTVVDYDPIWKDGDVVCVDCGLYLRSHDAG